MSTKKGYFLKSTLIYEVIVQSKNNVDVEFYHESINIRNKVTPITSKSKNLSGVIVFRGDIGSTDFIIKVNNKIELEITLEVYPTKVSYKEDYNAILRDVNEEIYKVKLSFKGSLSSAEGYSG